MLDGVHVDIRSYALLPSVTGVQKGSELRQGNVDLYVGLGYDLRLYGDSSYPRPRSKRHFDRVQLLLHIQNEEKAAQRGADPRQGVRDGAG